MLSARASAVARCSTSIPAGVQLGGAGLGLGDLGGQCLAPAGQGPDLRAQFVSLPAQPGLGLLQAGFLRSQFGQ